MRFFQHKFDQGQGVEFNLSWIGIFVWPLPFWSFFCFKQLITIKIWSFIRPELGVHIYPICPGFDICGCIQLCLARNFIYLKKKNPRPKCWLGNRATYLPKIFTIPPANKVFFLGGGEGVIYESSCSSACLSFHISCKCNSPKTAQGILMQF